MSNRNSLFLMEPVLPFTRLAKAAVLHRRPVLSNLFQLDKYGMPMIRLERSQMTSCVPGVGYNHRAYHVADADPDKVTLTKSVIYPVSPHRQFPIQTSCNKEDVGNYEKETSPNLINSHQIRSSLGIQRFLLKNSPKAEDHNAEDVDKRDRFFKPLGWSQSGVSSARPVLHEQQRQAADIRTRSKMTKFKTFQAADIEAPTTDIDSNSTMVSFIDDEVRDTNKKGNKCDSSSPSNFTVKGILKTSGHSTSTTDGETGISPHMSLSISSNKSKKKVQFTMDEDKRLTSKDCVNVANNKSRFGKGEMEANQVHWKLKPRLDEDVFRKKSKIKSSRHVVFRRNGTMNTRMLNMDENEDKDDENGTSHPEDSGFTPVGMRIAEESYLFYTGRTSPVIQSSNSLNKHPTTVKKKKTAHKSKCGQKKKKKRKMSSLFSDKSDKAKNGVKDSVKCGRKNGIAGTGRNIEPHTETQDQSKARDISLEVVKPKSEHDICKTGCHWQDCGAGVKIQQWRQSISDLRRRLQDLPCSRTRMHGDRESLQASNAGDQNDKFRGKLKYEYLAQTAAQGDYSDLGKGQEILAFRARSEIPGPSHEDKRKRIVKWLQEVENHPNNLA